MRVVLDSRGSSPASARVFSDGNAGRTIVATTSRCPAARRSAYGRRGAEVVVFPSSHGRVRVDAVLGELGRRGVLHVLCEGGGGIAAALLDANAVDRYVFFMAPSFLGGGGVPAVAGRGWLLGRSPRLEFGTVSRMGADIMIEARPMRSPAGRRATEI
jgi:diaminohydroxyphosphoribosylaminopyrimidine deaminase/5-amino-6-(5-phosphoribosylamino)uracil reductase